MLYGISSLFGFWTAFTPSVFLLTILGALLLTCGSTPSRLFKRATLAGLLALSLFLLGTHNYKLPEIPSDGIKGTLYFEIDSLSSSETHFGGQWVYQGKGKSFISSQWSEHSYEGKNFPSVLRLSKKIGNDRPLADSAYIIQGSLKKSKSGNYNFSPDKNVSWEKVKGSWSLAEKRHVIKNRLQQFIMGKISDSNSAKFLSGMITGQFEDRILRAEFGKLGLQHLMAISGFHFALLSGMIAFLVRWFAPPGIAGVILILLMTLYFIFLGSSPSIFRSWVMCMIGLAAVLIEKRPVSSNSLGAAFLCVVLYDPLLTLSIGFQFSCAVTASILIFYPLMSQFIDRVIASRPLPEMKKMSYLDQHLYCVLGLLKETLTLAFAVNVIALPMALFYFQKFPVLGLIYNLFIPFLVCCCMFLFMISTLVYLLIAPVGNLLYQLTSVFTHFFLNFIYQSPVSLNIYLKVEHFSTALFAFYLSGVFLLGIFLKMRLERERNVQKDLIL